MGSGGKASLRKNRGCGFSHTDTEETHGVLWQLYRQSCLQPGLQRSLKGAPAFSRQDTEGQSSQRSTFHSSQKELRRVQERTHEWTGSRTRERRQSPITNPPGPQSGGGPGTPVGGTAATCAPPVLALRTARLQNLPGSVPGQCGGRQPVLHGKGLQVEKPRTRRDGDHGVLGFESDPGTGRHFWGGGAWEGVNTPVHQKGVNGGGVHCRLQRCPQTLSLLVSLAFHVSPCGALLLRGAQPHCWTPGPKYNLLQPMGCTRRFDLGLRTGADLLVLLPLS